MLEDLHEALVASDWNRALAAANAMWCEDRSNLAARFVDACASHVEPVVPPPRGRGRIHTWWLERVFAQDPRDLAALVETFPRPPAKSERPTTPQPPDARWDGHRYRALAALTRHWRPPRWVEERMAALLGWPDDARLAGAIIELLFGRYSPSGSAMSQLFEAAAERLVALRDRRAIPALAACVAQPRGPTAPVRALQQQFGRLALQGLAGKRLDEPPDPSGPLVDACATLARSRITTVVPKPDLTPLWREVARHPEDRGVREVLADALVEAGDARGDAFILDLRGRNGRPMRGNERNQHDGRVRTLWRLHWHDWLGELSSVVSRRSSVVRDGMLEDIVITSMNADPASWDALALPGLPETLHRELVAVTALRTGWITAELFARVAGALPALRLVEVANPAQLDAVLPSQRLSAIWCRIVPARDGPVDIRTPPFARDRRGPLYRSWWDPAMGGIALVQRFASIAARAPNVTELAFDLSRYADTAANDIVDLLPTLRTQFPLLDRIVLSDRLIAALSPARGEALLAQPDIWRTDRFGAKAIVRPGQ